MFKINNGGTQVRSFLEYMFGSTVRKTSGMKVPGRMGVLTTKDWRGRTNTSRTVIQLEGDCPWGPS